MNKTAGCLDKIAEWSIIILPFAIAIAPAPISIFMGFLIFSFTAKKIIKKEKFFNFSPLSLPLLSLFTVTCISIFNSISYSDTLKGGILRLFMYIFILFAISDQIKHKASLKKIVISIGCSVILLSLDAIFQEATKKDFIRGYAPMFSLEFTRATASFKDPNTFGIYLSAVLPLVCGLALYYFKGLKKAAFSLICILGMTAALLTYSRPALLALYAALFILGWVKKNKMLMGFLIILPLAALLFTPRSIKNFAKEMEYNPIRFMCNDDRIAIYHNAINMIKDHPVIGVGANTFMKNYKKYKQSPEYRNVVTSDYLYAHNNFLHMAGEIGLTGSLIFLWFIFVLFGECIKIYRKLGDKFIKITSLCLSACLAAFLVNGLTESSLYSSRVALIFWYLAGLAMALNNFAHEDK